MKRFLLALMLLLLNVNRPAFAIGVEPLLINLNLSPGSSQTFEIIVTPEEREELTHLMLYQPRQTPDGDIQYEILNSTDTLLSKWIELETNRLLVRPGSKSVIRGTVHVPFDAKGSYFAVVMVEPDTAQTKEGIAFLVRYAVLLNINVSTIGIREEATVTELSLKQDELSESLLQFQLSNPSPLHYFSSAEAIIRDENNRLVERVDLRTPFAWANNQTATMVMPGAEVLFTGKLSQPLFPGKYNIRLFVRYGNSQIVKNKVVEISDADFSSSNVQVKYLKVTPNSLDARIMPGGSTSKVIQISNNSPEELEIKVRPHDIEKDYTNSIFSNASVAMRTNPEFTLAPRRQQRLVLTLNAPRDLAPGGYYGYLDINVFSNGELLEKHLVDLSLTTMGEVSYSAEVISLAQSTLDGEQLFSVDLKNLSNSEIVPEGTINLKDNDGTLKRTLFLGLEEGITRVLPQRVGRVVAVTKGIGPGEYIAEIVIRHNRSEITTAKFPVTVE